MAEPKMTSTGYGELESSTADAPFSWLATSGPAAESNMALYQQVQAAKLAAQQGEMAEHGAESQGGMQYGIKNNFQAPPHSFVLKSHAHVTGTASFFSADSTSVDQEMVDYDDSQHGNGEDTAPQAGPRPAVSDHRLFIQLRDAVDGYQSTANYCCGGSIPISPSAETRQIVVNVPGTSNFPIVAPPVTLRWDTPGNPDLAQKIQFPLDGQNPNSNALLQGLFRACSPGTFGLGGGNIGNVPYHRAGKLDRERFSSNFHPHDYGIVDAVQQILLPDFNSPGLDGRADHRGVLAELHQFNVYSGPSGRFPARVNIPRGATHFGSLVVCLPNPHEGGQLRVSQNNYTTFFDWSNCDSARIHWAAFFCDCEHEVLEMKSGHRITLTYNLYVTEQVGGVIQNYPTADAQLSPLYEGTKRMLQQPGFMRNGGIIGFYCAHQYAHSRKGVDVVEKLMPFALKGIDMALFSVFRALGLNVFVRPILAQDSLEDYYDSRYEEYRRELGENVQPLEVYEFIERSSSLIGDKFHPVIFSNDEPWQLPGGFSELENLLQASWPFKEHKKITWLNEHNIDGWEVALTHVSFGNEASLTWHYSHAVILIEIPPRGGASGANWC